MQLKPQVCSESSTYVAYFNVRIQVNPGFWALKCRTLDLFILVYTIGDGYFTIKK